MKCAILTLDEITKENKRFCLSAKRALKKCYQCNLYKGCESNIVNKEYENIVRDKKNAHTRYIQSLAKLDKKITEL